MLNLNSGLFYLKISIAFLITEQYNVYDVQIFTLAYSVNYFVKSKVIENFLVDLPSSINDLTAVL